MIIVENAIISEDILEREFICQLDKCKGACCVQGDAGAPLLHEEIAIIEENLDQIKTEMHKDGLALLDKEGFYTRDPDKELVTVCAPTGECVFVTYDELGRTNCAIELAHKKGKTHFLKPMSCHLYPIRAKRYGAYTAMNYHHWEICSDACAAGKEFRIPVYEFLKDALIRKMGESWYNELLQVAKDWKNRTS